MDIILWIGWGCSLVMIFFTAAILIVGARSVKSPHWGIEFRQAAEYELHRRRLDERKRSQSEMSAIPRMLGPEPAAITAEESTAVFDFLQALTAAPDRAVLERELEERRDEVLDAALSRQLAAVSKVPSRTIASRWWVAHRYFSEAVTFARGLGWFLPRCLPQIRHVGEKYLATATLLGVWCGLLYWGFSTWATGPGAAGGASWLNIVGVVITLSTVMGLVLAVGSQFKLIATYRFGPIRHWTAKGISTGISLLLIVMIVTLLFSTGVPTDWTTGLTNYVSRIRLDSGASMWIGNVILVLCVGYVTRNAVSWARLRQLKLRDRIGAAAAAFVALILIIFVILLAFDAPSTATDVTVLVFGWGVLVAGMSYVTCVGVEWLGSYRALNKAGSEIPRRGFRWWALTAWILALPSLSLMSSALTSESISAQYRWSSRSCPGSSSWLA
ncbi:hypothetical protein [Pseudarthrobacter sp. Y6]|uniref:hypothetical protein n=1 Tax=Pseudarthrobacter sp. Y6 TaxID=3418422 RepID=UPI003CE960A5